jgi:hypothetical protein
VSRGCLRTRKCGGRQLVLPAAVADIELPCNIICCWKRGIGVLMCNACVHAESALHPGSPSGALGTLM